MVSAPAGQARRRLLFRRELGDLLRLATPIILSQLGQIGMNTADTVMVGPLGALPLAAVGVGSAIHMVALTIGMGIIVGMGPLVSQAYGAGDQPLCRRVLVQGGWLSVALTLPLVGLHLFGQEIALLLGQQPDVAAVAGDYLAALLPGILPIFLFLAFRQFLEGMGTTTPPMVITLVALAINVAANRVFIYGVEGWVPALGAVGTGWATSVVRWSMLLLMLAYVLRRPDLHPFRGVPRRPDRALFARILRVGTPIGAQFGLEVGLFAFAAVMMGWLGAVELAAHQVTINIAATTFMVSLGVSLAGAIRVGQCIGARRPRMMRRSVQATYVLAVAFMAACALLFVAVPEALVRLYTPDEEIVVLGSSLLLVAALFQVFDGAQVAGVSVLRGAGDTHLPMLIAGVGYWVVGLPVGFYLGFVADLGPVGVWLGLSAGLAVVAVVVGVRVRRILWGPPERLSALQVSAPPPD
ncbi:MAG: MATE family efflux transporter [Gemmatimonadota bacterium]